MSPKDHNKTLVVIHVGGGILLFAFGVVETILIGRHNIRIAVIIFAITLVIALLMFSTAIAMHRQKPLGRTLALLSAFFLLIVFWPAAIYSWWFMHSDGAKQMYGVKDE